MGNGNLSQKNPEETPAFKNSRSRGAERGTPGVSTEDGCELLLVPDSANNVGPATATDGDVMPGKVDATFAVEHLRLHFVSCHACTCVCSVVP